MKRSSVGIQKEPTIMIIPMIDIVFFLLVFFMMSYVIYEYRGTNSAQFAKGLCINGKKRLSRLRFHSQLLIRCI